MTQQLAAKESLVNFQNSLGVKLRAGVLRLTRHSVFFEVYNPAVVFQTSEILQEFQIIYQDRTIYSGRAVLRGAVNTGMVTVCEATLEDYGARVAMGLSRDFGLSRSFKLTMKNQRRFLTCSTRN